jgi:CRISPR-associated protein Csh2
MHQNTSVFASSTDKTRGAIGTTTVVPYSINQIHGWVNPYAARHTSLAQADVDDMLAALWHSINNANTRTKSNQNSLLLLLVNYADPANKLYGLDRLIKLSPLADKRDEQIRNREDYVLDFTKLKAIVATTPAVKSVSFFTQDGAFDKELRTAQKFVPLGIK